MEDTREDLAKNLEDAKIKEEGYRYARVKIEEKIAANFLAWNELLCDSQKQKGAQ